MTPTPKRADREYLIRLRVPPGESDAAGVRRLRAFLKSALRRFQLRCVTCEPASDASHPVEADKAADSLKPRPAPGFSQLNGRVDRHNLLLQ